VTVGSPNTEKGLHQLSADSTSADVNIDGRPARDCSKSAGQTFAVDPNFLSYATETITITAVVRRGAANENAGFKQSMTAAKVGPHRRSLAQADRPAPGGE
jgi:hypothetical protein